MEPQSGTMMAGKVGKSPMMAMKEFTGLASDSREVEPGYLFAALTGAQADGARFIDDAVKRGAARCSAGPKIARRGRGARRALHRRRESAACAGAHGGSYFGAQPEDRRRRHRHQRQNLRRRVPAPDLGELAQAASMGTIGVVAPTARSPLAHTTPDPIEIHRLLAQLKNEGVDHLALEASSHGLRSIPPRRRGDRGRAPSPTSPAIIMDYHASFEEYLAAKLRLFGEVAARRRRCGGQCRCRPCRAFRRRRPHARV